MHVTQAKKSMINDNISKVLQEQDNNFMFRIVLLKPKNHIVEGKEP
jgi:hypothetical protein